MHGAVLLEMVKSHINETYLSYVIDEVGGKSKGPNTLVKAVLGTASFFLNPQSATEFQFS